MNDDDYEDDFAPEKPFNRLSASVRKINHNGRQVKEAGGSCNDESGRDGRQGSKNDLGEEGVRNRVQALIAHYKDGARHPDDKAGKNIVR